MWKILVGVVALLGTCHADDDMFNQLVDEFLVEMEQDWHNQGHDRVTVQEFHKSFSYLLWRVDMSVHSAWLQNMSSIVRVGDAIAVTEDDGSITLSSSFTMKDLTLHLDQADIEVSGANLFKNSVSASIDQNTIFFKVNFLDEGKDKCKVTLENCEVTALSGFKVTYQPSNFFNNLKGWLTTKALGLSSSYIRKHLNGFLLDGVRQQVQKLDLCNLMPF